MNRLVILSISVFAILLTLTSCNIFEFEPKGESYVEIDQELAVFDVEWEEMADTLDVWDSINFSYQVDDSDNLISLVGLAIDDVIVAEAPVGQRIWLDSRTISDGIYPMQLVALGSSGTGSLLDKLEGEYQIISTSTKYIYIDNGPLGTVEIDQFTLNEDGTLMMQWEPYERPRFGGYTIRDVTYCDEYIPNCYGGYAPDGITSWTDEAYDGNDREYVIVMHDRRSNSAPSIGDPSKFTDGPPSTKFTEIIEPRPGTIQLHWSPTVYPKSFFYYTIEMQSLNGDYTELGSFRDINQTQLEYDIPLGTKAYIVLTTVRDSYPDRDKFYADSIFVENGRSFTQHGHVTNFVKFLPQLNHYLVLQEDNLMLLSGDSLNMLEQVSINSGSSADFNFRVSNDLSSFVVVQGTQVKIYSTENLAVLHHFHIGEYYPGLSNVQLSNPILDDNNNFWFNLGPNTGTKVLNLQTMQKVDYQIPAGSNHFVSDVHPDGNRFLGRLPSIPGSGSMNQYTFDSDGETVLIKNYSPNFSLEAAFSRDGSIVYTTDEYNHVIGNDTYSHAEVVNLELPWTLEETVNLDVNQKMFYYWNLDKARYELRSLDDGSMRDHFWIGQFQSRSGIRFEHKIVWFENGMYQFIDELRKR